MGLKCGIVGLPNVGKSTLFNAITKAENAEAMNYPFCTIEPNSAIISLVDKRLQKVAEIAGSEKAIFSILEIVDIAGLVRGASKGEGLGNKFLSHIREVDAIIHLVRTFEEKDITHVEDSVDPVRDIEIIETELMLADLESVEGRITKNSNKVKQKNEEAMKDQEILLKVRTALENGEMINTLIKANVFDKEQLKALNQMQFITAKPVLYAANVSEDEISSTSPMLEKLQAFLQSRGTKAIPISAKLEFEMSSMKDTELEEFMSMYQLTESGLNKIVHECFSLLSLKTYFTAGPKEARAWIINDGDMAPEAAGVIHSDFKKKFIKADVTSYEDYLLCNGEIGAKDSGKVRSEGKEYVVQDADIILFKTGG